MSRYQTFFIVHIVSYLGGFLFLCIFISGCSKHVDNSKVPSGSGPKDSIMLTSRQIERSNIRIESVQKKPVHETRTVTGKITFSDSKVAHVVSPVSGRVVQIHAHLGQKVEAGTSLATIDSPDFGQSTADVDRAEADLNTAEHAFARQKDLYANHAVSKRDFEASEDIYLKAKADYERTRQKLRLLHSEAGAVSQSFSLRSPIAGEVIARSLNPGEEVQGQYNGSGAGNELFTIGSLETVFAIGDLFEMDLPKVHQNDKVEVRVAAYPDRAFQGHIDWISSQFDPNTRTAQIRCSIPNTDGLLKPEMFATLSVTCADQISLVVNRNSLFRIGDNLFVFKKVDQDDHKNIYFMRQKVNVDETFLNDELPVYEGLREGDKIITQGGILLTLMQ